jgi:hypothetical protein
MQQLVAGLGLHFRRSGWQGASEPVRGEPTCIGEGKEELVGSRG